MEKAKGIEIIHKPQGQIRDLSVAVPNVSVTYYLMCAMVTKPVNAPVCTSVGVKFSPAL